MKRLAAILYGILSCALSVAQAADQLSLDTTSKLLAGISPDVQQSVPLKKHHDKMSSEWVRLYDTRITAIRQWRDREITHEQCTTLLYPFSGADFINPYVLFPTCDTYVLFGLEAPGKSPELQKMTDQQLELYLSDMRTAIDDLIERNYFITMRMSTQLHTSNYRGTAPIIMATMAAGGLEVQTVEQITVPTKGIKIVAYHRALQKYQTVYYFQQNAVNVELRNKPEFLAFLSRDKNSFMLIKSASYLLHDPQFTTIRDTLLNTSTYLVQDDTGVPYAVLKARRWNITIYGIYQRPVSDFNYGYQLDLAALYSSTPNVKPLPFSFGYHWRNGKSGLIIARK